MCTDVFMNGLERELITEICFNGLIFTVSMSEFIMNEYIKALIRDF